MPWRTAPAWPERPPPVTVAMTSNWLEAVGGLQRLLDHHLQHGPREILLEVLAVDGDLADAGLDPDARDGVLALAGGVGAALRVELLRVGGALPPASRAALERAEVLETSLVSVAMASGPHVLAS